MKLQVQNIHFAYPSRPVLANISFNIQPVELVAILGTNGTGKTTLLKTINRILKPSTGVIYANQTDIATLSSNHLAQNIAYVAQQRQGTRTTVFNAVLLGRKPYLKWNATAQDLEITSQALNTLGLSDYALRYLDELSGGELQKVVIARALAQQPNLLLLDEPTSSLDLKNQLEVLQLVKTITQTQNIAALVTMHDINLALRYADRFILLKDQTIYAAGNADIITPQAIEAIYAVPVTLSTLNGHRFVVPI